MAEASDRVTLPGLEAAADLSAKQYHFVRVVSATTCNQASAANDAGVVGVLDNKPQSGEAATIVTNGMSPVTCGASMGVGARFTTNGSGRAAVVTSGQYVLGIALEAAAADGDIVTGWLRDPYYFGG